MQTCPNKISQVWASLYKQAAPINTYVSNKKALIPLGIRAFPNFAFPKLRCVRD